MANRRQTKQNGAPPAKSALTRREAADYIAALLEELKSLAHGAGLPFVAYLLAMAKQEAQTEKSRED